MKVARVILLSIAICAPAKGQSIANGNAKASGPCSVAHSGNNDVITIENCGIGKEQADTIIAILKAVLENQKADDRDTKLAQLLELAKRAANPYGTVTTYEPNGIKRTHNESTGTFGMDQSAQMDVPAIAAKEKAGDWRGEIDLLQKAIDKYPGWFTPFLWLGEAQGMLCHTSEASAAFTRFLKDTEGADAYAPLRIEAQRYFDGLQSPGYIADCANRKPLSN